MQTHTHTHEGNDTRPIQSANKNLTCAMERTTRMKVGRLHRLLAICPLCRLLQRAENTHRVITWLASYAAYNNC